MELAEVGNILPLGHFTFHSSLCEYFLLSLPFIDILERYNTSKLQWLFSSLIANFHIKASLWPVVQMPHWRQLNIWKTWIWAFDPFSCFVLMQFQTLRSCVLWACTFRFNGTNALLGMSLCTTYKWNLCNCRTLLMISMNHAQLGQKVQKRMTHTYTDHHQPCPFSPSCQSSSHRAPGTCWPQRCPAAGCTNRWCWHNR